MWVNNTIEEKHLIGSINLSELFTLVALVLFGDVPKWSGQGHFEDTSGTRTGCAWDISGRGHIFRRVWERTWDKYEEKKKDIGKLDSGLFCGCPKMVRIGTF